MLLEVGIMFTSYLGVRLYERYYSKPKLTIKNQFNQKNKQYQTKKIVNAARENREVTNLTSYLKISTISIGLAVMRTFYPIVAPLSLAVYIYTTVPFMRHVEKSLFKERKVDVDVLFFMGDTLILATSQYITAAIGLWALFWGQYFVKKAKGHSKKMLLQVFYQQPRQVWVLKNKVEEVEMPLEAVQVGNIVVVNTGEVIPVDGRIVKGIATVDQHALTGESQPVEKELGDQVFAATLMISGRVYIEVEKSGQETNIAKINQMLQHSAEFKPQLQLKGEEWANKATVPMLWMSGVILLTLGPIPTVVFIASHSGVSIRILGSLGTLNHITLASSRGILIKDGRALEKLTQVDTVLFDKTGTLTHEQPKVGKIIICDHHETEHDILRYAAIAERKLTHPIAKAIIKYAQDSHLSLPEIEDSQYQVGYGITVRYQNQIIRVGSLRFMIQEGLTIPEIITTAQVDSHQAGYSLVLVAINHQVSGAIEIQTQVRCEVKKTIQGLRQRGIKLIAIVSGDHQQPTQKLATELGMDDYFYDILPAEKAHIVEQLQKEGKTVCFVGDGINDAVAMKKADVSISLRGATTMATDTAEIILMDGNLSRITHLIDISTNLKTNLRKSLAITLMSGATNLAGAFLFHFSIMTAIIVGHGFFLLGMGNTMLSLKGISNKANKKTDTFDE